MTDYQYSVAYYGRTNPKTDWHPLPDADENGLVTLPGNPTYPTFIRLRPKPLVWEEGKVYFRIGERKPLAIYIEKVFDDGDALGWAWLEDIRGGLVRRAESRADYREEDDS